MKNTGKNFESKVLEAITEILNDGKLGLLHTSCKVFTQKGYYSRDREKDIKADISIEVFVYNSPQPSFIWIWECKDYRGQISVDEIEELHSKLEQIGSDNTKGTVITSSGAFQSSAINYAKAKGIGLARLMPENQIEWFQYYGLPNMNVSNRSKSMALVALNRVTYIAKEKDFFGLTTDSQLSTNHSLKDYIRYEIKQIVKKAENVFHDERALDI